MSRCPGCPIKLRPKFLPGEVEDRGSHSGVHSAPSTGRLAFLQNSARKLEILDV